MRLFIKIFCLFPIWPNYKYYVFDLQKHSCFKYISLSNEMRFSESWLSGHVLKLFQKSFWKPQEATKVHIWKKILTFICVPSLLWEG